MEEKARRNMMKTSLKLFVVITLFVSAAAIAQKTTYEVRRGTVVTTFSDQLVVKMSDGQTRQFTIPAGFQFNVDGRTMSLSELTPGTELTATISTTVTPQVVRTTRIRNGEVIR